MSLQDEVQVMLLEQQNPQPEFLTTYTRLLRLNGRLSWRDTVQAIRLLIMGGTPEEIRLAFLRELSPDRANGEMLAGAAAALRELAPRVPFHDEPLFDCVGTGGDGLGSFNLSTMSALVVAAAGVPTAKHGNKAITSSCGAADLVEGLGIPINLSPTEAAVSLEEHRFAFLFAPAYHGATRNVQPLRKKLSQEGRKTLFNLLGPLSNPARPTHMMVGAYDPMFLDPMANALSVLDVDHAWVFCGSTGTGAWMDEISPCGKTKVVRVGLGGTDEFEIAPQQAGLKPVGLDSIRGGEPNRNVELARRIMEGEGGALLDSVALSAGACFWMLEETDNLTAGFEMAKDLLTTGKVRDLVSNLSSRRMEKAA